MDPVTGALLGGIASSLLAPKPQYVVPNYKGIRNAAEKAGFNPLTALTQGPQGSVVQGQNYMGAAISDALLIAAGDKEKDARISLLEAQTENYKKSVENMTLRPKIGGVYEKRNADAAASASGATNDQISTAVPSDRTGDSPVVPLAFGGRPLASNSVVDPRREVDNASVKTSSGFMVVDNPHIPFSIYAPTLDGDEPLQWYDLPTLAINAGGSMAYDAYDMRQTNKPQRDLERRYFSTPEGKSWLAGKRINKGGPLRQPSQTRFPLSLAQRQIMAGS